MNAFIISSCRRRRRAALLKGRKGLDGGFITLVSKHCSFYAVTFGLAEHTLF